MSNIQGFIMERAHSTAGTETNAAKAAATVRRLTKDADDAHIILTALGLATA